MPYGYNQRILRIDLTRGTLTDEAPEEIIYRRYMGGSALALYYLLKEQKPGTDPLGPKNKLIFMSNVVQGAPISGLTKFTVAARSPLTGAFGEGEAGGYWGPELKFAGYDGLIIEGRSACPVYLWLKDGKAEIRDASNLWGKDTAEVQEQIQAELGDSSIRVAQCGQAGENLVRYACILNGLSYANGRTGLGAVMGSKNLRAVAVRGPGKLAFADPGRVQEIARQVTKQLPDCAIAQNFKKYGTAVSVMPNQAGGILPTRNFASGQFEGAEKISAETMLATIFKKAKSCYGCAIRCKRVVEVEGKYATSPEYGGPEYETIVALGSLCGVDNLEAIAHGNALCNRWGLDTISTGASIAFAMECTERGILSGKDTDGINLRFGNIDGMLEMIRKIAFRDGFGAILGEGVSEASRRIGKGSEGFAMHVKGQELPMHDPRGKHGVALGYALSPTGADHMEAPHDPAFAQEGPVLHQANPAGVIEPIIAQDLGPKKIAFFVHTQQIWSFFNSLGVCNFAGAPYSSLTLPMISDAVNAVTGWNTSVHELMELGERAITMARMFNVLEGLTAKEDTLPRRLFEPLEKATAREKQIKHEDLARAIRHYYEALGWNPDTGVPTEGRLSFLSLDWLIK